MRNWKKTLIKEHHSLLETMKLIDETALQFAIVVDSDNRLLGTVTDGDIRRALLKGKSLTVNIKEVMNPKPTTGTVSQTKRQHIKILKSNKLKQLPIIGENDRIIDVVLIDDDKQSLKENTVLLMVGGLGTRLRPLTNDIPKPMLQVGGKPLLETIIEGFKQYGYSNFILSVNYKKEIIQDYFQDGEAFGVTISYIVETKRMGTAGALSLLPRVPTEPMIVMNGDLLTQINYDQLMQFHLSQNALATMCVREFEYQIPYGVIETDDTRLTSIKEKPIQKNFVNAGIYVLNPEVFNFIPENQFFDMPDLFERLIEDNKNVAVFPIREYWLDIGRIEDFERANEEYEERYK